MIHVSIVLGVTLLAAVGAIGDGNGDGSCGTNAYCSNDCCIGIIQ